MNGNVTFQISLTWAVVVVIIAILIFFYNLSKES